MLDILYNGVGYVLIKYNDNSCRVFKSTLSKEVFRNIEVSENSLFDLDKRIPVLLDEDVKEIIIEDDLSKLIGEIEEVDIHVNQFL